MFKNIYRKKYNHKTINEFKYILSAQRVTATHNTVH
jgi:hypothetical protein